MLTRSMNPSHRYTRLGRTIGLLVAAWCATAAANDAPQWQRIAPEGTTCWDGTPWHFFYREANATHAAGEARPQRLAIWFGNGDACWNASLCAAVSHVPLDLSAPQSSGLLDRTRTANPLDDFAQVWLPDCTLDMQTGDRIVDYPRASSAPFTVAHVGARNVRAALAALHARVGTPSQIFVGGDGSGGIAAAYWSDTIGERWPNAQLIVLGAGSGGYRSHAANAALAQWGALDALPNASAFADHHKIYFESFYIATAERHPAARLGEVNFANDAVQRRLMAAFGTPVPKLSKPLQCNMNEVRINAAGFHSFMVPGTQHAILDSDAVYAMHCDAQSLIGWIDDLVAGRPLETHWCDGELTLHTHTDAPTL
jgi:hypothetical protein